MGKSATNILIVLGIATIAFAAYYFYTKKNASEPSFDVNEQTMQNMLGNTRAFLGYKSTLREVKLDYSFFESDEFLSLQSFSKELKDYEKGRENPFAEVEGREIPENN